ncbi:MAG TPA: hypothetical protein VH482_25780 [Thermomicrobiales bacterium]
MSWRDEWETTRYVITLDPASGGHNRMRVRVRSEHRVVVRFSVQYETDLDGTTYPVVRYDTAHGFAHRDLLDRAGHNVDKLYLGDESRFGRVLDDAIADIKANWADHLESFLKGVP